MPIDPLLAQQPGVSSECESAVPALEGDARLDENVEPSNGPTVRVGDVVVREDIESAYRRLYPQLVRLAFFLVDTVEHAEEAVQDSFAKAYPKWGRIEDADAYMHMTVIHTCRNVQRRRGLMHRTRPALSFEEAALGADHVADVVRRLPRKLRQVVVLRYYLQLSEPEIARTLGMALGIVKSTLHRARAQLKEELS